MNFKTREGSNNIKGKPKVYIAGHPDDMKTHFERICAEIMEICDCVIFYDEDIESVAGSDDFLMDLEQMQLIVLIVSQIYTKEKSAAQSIVFPYATQHFIPVLPILEAEEFEIDLNDNEIVAKAKKEEMTALLKTLNEMLGNRQYLDPHDKDKTALSYKVKLKKYLDSICADGNLADKIRAAFDAYVFLSYRKKDRAYAQELMKLIHRNTFCRDIAIWYDEFLVPGEDFSSAIRTAMQKSELFTLVVTPSILEENNYVMTTEYPAAKDSSMKILPVTMVPTDTQKLREHYDSIPESINPSKEQLLSDALERELENVMNPERNNDPQHVFFIGLAYLRGIDVEIDKERAMELISHAAQCDPELRPAVKQLAGMYYTGEGTPIDYSEAAKWYKKLAELDQKNYEKDPTPEQAAAWLESMLSYGNSLYEMGRGLLSACDTESGYPKQFDQSYDTYKKIVRFCEQTEISECWAGLYISACTAMKNMVGYVNSNSNFKGVFEPIITCAKRIIQSRNLPATLKELEQRLAQDESLKKAMPLDTDYCKPFYLLYEEYRNARQFGQISLSLHLRGKKSDCPDQAKYDAATEAIEIYMKLTGTDWTLAYLHIVTELERRIELQKRFLPDALTEKKPFDSFLSMKAIMKSYSIYITKETDFERIKPYYEECLATMKAFSELKCFPYILDEFYSWATREAPGFYDEGFDFIDVFNAMLKKAPDSYREVCAEDYFLYMCRVFRSCPRHYAYDLNESFGWVFMCCVFQNLPREYTFSPNENFHEVLKSCQKNDTVEKAIGLTDKAIDALNVIIEDKDLYATCSPLNIDNIVLGISWTIEKCKEMGKDSDAERLSQFINAINFLEGQRKRGDRH